MRKFILLFFVLASLSASAKKFVIEDFFYDPNDLLARSSGKKDINGDRCAIIRVLTDIQNLSFDSNMGITKVWPKENNEIWLFVSPGEKRLEISAPDFMPEVFVIPKKIESACVYWLKLTSDDVPLRVVEGRGNLSITTNPPGAKVYLEGIPNENKVTPVVFENINALDYKLILSKDRYFTLDTTVAVQAEKNTTLNFMLSPKFSDVTITSEPEGALVLIDEVEKGRTPLKLHGEADGLDHGEHLISLSHKDCYDLHKNIKVTPGLENTFDFEINQISGTLNIRTIPDGATVRLDNKFVGITPLFNVKVNKGKKILDINKAGYSGIRKEIKIGEDEELVLLDTLSESKTMLINTKPEGAQLYVNEMYLGVTPVKIPVVKGENDFKFVMKDYVTKEVTENITGEQLKFEYRMDFQQYEVKVNSEPQGANVYIKSELKGVTPCNVFLPNDKVRIKWEKTGFIPRQQKLKPGETDFEITTDMRRRVKESETVGFCFEFFGDKEYKARFDAWNFLILKLGWQKFEDNVFVGDAEFKSLGNFELQLSPTFPITRYAELSPFCGVGREWAVNDTSSIFKSMASPSLSTFYYNYGAYVYGNIINNVQVYILFSYSSPIDEIKYDEEEIEESWVTENSELKKWNDIFDDRLKFKIAFGIRIRLGGS